MAWEKALSLYRYFDRDKGGLRHIELFRNNLEGFYEAQFGPTLEGASAIHAAFEIDWTGGVEKVIEDFAKWARERWAGLRRKKKPRSLYYEWLKQLGVMRLKDKLGTWSKAQKYSEEVLGDPIYQDDENLWRRARLAAKKRAKEMFPIIETRFGATGNKTFLRT